MPTTTFTAFTFQEFVANLGGRFSIPAVDAGIAIGIAVKTTRNQLVAGTFPLPSFRQNGRRMVRSIDLYIYCFGDKAGQTAAAVEPEPAKPAKRGPGRPRKSKIGGV